MVESINGIRVIHTKLLLSVGCMYYGGKVISIDKYDDGFLLTLKYKTTTRQIIVWG